MPRNPVTAHISPELGEHGQHWNRLAAGSASPFLSSEWLCAWWSAYGRGSPTWLLVTDDDDALCAGALLQRRRGRLAAAANVHSGDWDAVSRDGEAQAELWDAVAGLRASRVALDAMPEHAGGADVATSALEQAGYRVFRLARPSSPYLALPPSWDELIGSVSKGLRSQLGRRRRNLERRGELTFKTEVGDRAVGAQLERFLRLEAAGWKGRAGTAIVSDARTQRLYRDFAAGAAAQGWFRLHKLELDGELIAADYGCAFAGAGFLIKTTFDEAYADSSPGLVLRGEVLKACIDENLRSYDFLGGPDPYKLRWTGDVRPRIAVWGYRGATRGGYLYRARLRPLMRDAIGPMLRRPPKRSGETPSSR
jgi:CelD/BcsL family acetyltransferase involved in cellulose biosynthesis